jgi:DNA-binding transcriptional regulator YiaG
MLTVMTQVTNRRRARIIGARIREHREHLGVSQAVLAGWAGVRQQRVGG